MDARPSLRGWLLNVLWEPALGPNRVAALLLALVRSAEATGFDGDAPEWTSDAEHVGRVGARASVTIVDPAPSCGSARAPSVGQLASPRGSGAAGESEGLVIIAGPRRAGNDADRALVDLINRRASTRDRHRTRIAIAQTASRCKPAWIGGGDAQLLAAARAALRGTRTPVLEQIHLRTVDLLGLRPGTSGHHRASRSKCQ